MHKQKKRVFDRDQIRDGMLATLRRSKTKTIDFEDWTERTGRHMGMTYHEFICSFMTMKELLWGEFIGSVVELESDRKLRIAKRTGR